MLADIRELISLDDVMEELGLGPNGGLVYCMEYPFSSIMFKSTVYLHGFHWFSLYLPMVAFCCFKNLI